MIEHKEKTECTEKLENSDFQKQCIEKYEKLGSKAGASGYTDMAEYYASKKQKILEEKELREQEYRMDKAVHGSPDYAGFGGWRESEYIYEAEKEYAKHGNSLEYQKLLKGAAKAHVREEYGDILK